MQSIEQELWKPIPGYEGRYEASDQGRIRSLPRIVSSGNRSGVRSVPGVLRTAWRDPKGYLSVNIARDGDRARSQRVHNLVLMAFVGPKPTPEHQARHLDGDPSNNRPSNLRWGTSSENNLDRVVHGTHPLAARSSCLRGHPLDETNTYVNPSGYRSCKACRRTADHQYRLRAAAREQPEHAD